MKKLSEFAHYWLPPLLWMSLIFYFSSQPRIEISEKDLLNFTIFKTLHMVEYGFLYFLLLRGFHGIHNSFIKRYIFLIPLVITILYGISDEVHQTFVPSREGKLRDVIFDTAGAYIMYLYARKNLSSLKRFF